MARTAVFSDTGDEGTTRDNVESSLLSSRRVDEPSLSPSPAASFSSDKENRPAAQQHGKGKSRSMGPPQYSASERPNPRQSLKRKLSERDGPLNATQTVHRQRLEDVGNTDFYDPEQSMEQRRALRRDYRDLSRELTDSRAEYLAPGSDGLIQTLNRSNQLFTSVKQTSDATLDSRLLVSTADLSMKRTTQLTLGDNTTGIDIDDFVSKCIIFMRRALEDGATPTQTQRRRRVGDDSDEEGHDGQGYDEGDAFNWEYLGRHACCPYSVRPPMPGFLLGPLSVQKRVRKATQRRERLQKHDPKDAVRPEELQAKDLEQAESSNLKTICTNILVLLKRYYAEGPKRVQQEADENMSEEKIYAITSNHGAADDGGVPLFHFAVNPHSFGQTVENLFYLSFLIKDGYVGLGNDSNGIPTIFPQGVRDPKERAKADVQKRQAVFHLDYDIWQDIIETFDIKRSLIPHRQPDPGVSVGANGWYA